MWPFKKKEVKDNRPIVVIKDCTDYCKDGYLPGRENRCPKWVILRRTYDINGKIQENSEGRCAIAWIPDLLIELRLEKLGK